jgi:hypothetical protein
MRGPEWTDTRRVTGDVRLTPGEICGDRRMTAESRSCGHPRATLARQGGDAVSCWPLIRVFATVLQTGIANSIGGDDGI